MDFYSKCSQALDGGIDELRVFLKSQQDVLTLNIEEYNLQLGVDLIDKSKDLSTPHIASMSDQQFG